MLYKAFGVLIVVMVLANWLKFLFFPAIGLGVVLLAVVFYQYRLLYYTKGGIVAHRKMANKLSVGSENIIKIDTTNNFNTAINIEIVDDLPYQLQIRDFKISTQMQAGENKLYNYTIHPTTRGIYEFDKINVFVSVSKYGLLQRKFEIEATEKISVYPSLIHMQEIELKSISKISVNQGVKKQRRLGHSYEFEQIKQYVQGDDYRSINWRATARNQNLMINQYEDEKSQPIYFIIDKGRNMKMPFNGLSLADYAVNTTLAISNVALNKGDRVGLMTFDKNFDQFVKAENKKEQLFHLMQSLYTLEQNDLDSNFSALYSGITHRIKQRSLIFLFTNCNTLHTLQRIKPTLSLIAKRNLLVVIMFENSEIAAMTAEQAKTLEEIYEKTIAEKFIYEQRLIASELNTIGIQTIVSKPENLSINTINQYLSLKAKGMF
ncbi:MAG: DUF58 domain-containing protein [Flavobacteriales bacterium]|nr:DUF58 domain-containing protein [Flavobacteriales bacterium]